LYGGPQHRRQIPSQLDLKPLAILAWREHDGVRMPRSTSVAPTGCPALGALAISGCNSGGGSAAAASLAFSSSRRAAFAFISSRTSDGATPFITISISFLRRISMSSISRSAADRLAVLHPKPVHLASEFVAELFEEFLVQELLLESLEDPRFNFVSSDGEVVAAGTLLASAEACETVAAGHDEAGAAHAAKLEAGSAAPFSLLPCVSSAQRAGPDCLREARD
jgi:hypothetical protein